MTVVISGLKPTITCPATLYIPVDGGKFHAHVFSVIFKRMPADQRDALNQDYLAGKLTTTELLDKVVDGWGGALDDDGQVIPGTGMLDASGQSVPYSAEERKATNIAWPGLEEAMGVSWYDHLFYQQRDAARKNSKALSGTTSAPTAQTATS